MDKELLCIYEKLGEEVCQLEDIRQIIAKKSFLPGNFKKSNFLLNRNAAFSIDLLIENAIECGTLNNKIWKYVVR